LGILGTKIEYEYLVKIALLLHVFRFHVGIEEGREEKGPDLAFDPSSGPGGQPACPVPC
jgi:hypothetical protein